jgi:DNA-binding CsgD family transcriptional regulator
MLGAFGVCDLFWWSILGSYLDYNDNAAKVLGVGLSMNVLGVFIGGVIGREIASLESSHFVTSIIAVTIIFAVLIIFPVLNSQLTKHLKSHEFLVKFADMAKRKKDINISVLKNDKRLTEKESEVINLMLRGYTYKGIAEYLSLSENTIKYHIKNIYQKFNVSSKMELMKVLTDNEEMQQ